jgi:hypothetical protein
MTPELSRDQSGLAGAIGYQKSVILEVARLRSWGIEWITVAN